MVPIIISLIEDYTESTRATIPNGQGEVITSKVYYMVNRYGISVSQMTTNMFRLSESQSHHPFL